MESKLIDFAAMPSAPKSEETSSEAKVSWARRIRSWLWKSMLTCFLISFLMVGLWGILPVPLTPLMVIRVFENLVEGKTVHFNKDWVPLEKISPKLQYAVIASEDYKFMEHNGFDFEAINKAIKNNKRGKRIKGGSTISQQVAKNVFLWPARSWFRKGLEAYFTALIEVCWSKHRIMEVYLNVIELGDGVYGAEAAARHYFHKPAARLNSSEAALMAAVLPNPRRYKIGRPSGYVLRRQSLIMRRIHQVTPLNLD